MSLSAGCSLGAALASEREKDGVDVLLSAARRQAWPEVVTSLVVLVSNADAAVAGLTALNMIALEPSARTWVWHARKAVCQTVTDVVLRDSDRLGPGDFEREIRSADILGVIGWFEDSLQLLRNLLQLPVVT